HRIGRFSDVSKSSEYHDRIEAINFSLAHDDGQSARNLEHADVILIGVSRSGKTPTSLYLAMQHGIKAANYPLIPEDFERGRLPGTLAPFKRKCFGLTIDPDRLSQIRHERRPGSRYAALENCRYEVNEAEAMMRRESIGWLSSTHKSIEEIATTILRDLRPDRLIY
ncbi:MAG: kinase/pyrophosphorylase, partial [Rubrivivax sp.]|nr:kinase/pyrophosphorylase [Rubrivivax sp.]